MPVVFQCPHCEKDYPKKSSLIGRKVRCSDCKGVFQLQGDGSVLKVTLEDQTTKGAGTKRQVTRQLTRRSKRVDEESINARLEKSRTSLRDAAQAALSGVQGDQEKQLKKQQQGQAKQASGPTDAQGAQSIEIYRSRRKPSPSPFKFVLLTLGVMVLSVVLVIVFYPDVSPQQKALTDFAALVEQKFSKYPLRMLEYRKRMWIYTRDGEEFPSIILNADKSDMTALTELPWQRMTEICQKHFGGMSSMPFFAIMAESEKQAMVEEMWRSYHDKFYIEAFYKQLARKGIRYIHFRKIPDLLKQEGMSDRESYIISLLLAGTGDTEGKPCKDFGLISSIKAQSAFMCEFSGSAGLRLVERANDYEVLGSADFCGMVLGVTGIPGQEDQWRVLDVRSGKDMNQFYAKKYNPFLALSVRVSDFIKKNYLSIEDQAKDQQQQGIEE